mmetsp:Transcript_40805/g.86831  ORF Transcript_40805/g.86831 Transcript_40805/m.86831 type:complete len:313 (+) Transcript_40805:88-1026(+)
MVFIYEAGRPHDPSFNFVFSVLSCLLFSFPREEDAFWVLEGSEEPIHVGEELSVVVPVGGVVDCVVTGSHDGWTLHLNAVVNVRRPDRRREEHHLVRQRVHRDHEERPKVRHGLQNSVQRMKGQACKWRQSVLLVVLVVDVMQLVVTQPEIVKQPVVPVDPKLHEEHVEEEGREVGRVAVLVHPDVRQSPPALHDVLAQRRQEAVHRQGPEAHLHLLRHVTELWRVRLGEEGVAVDAVDVVRPGHPETQVDQVGEHEAPEPGPRHQGPRVQLDRLLQALGKEAERQPVLPLGLLLQQVLLERLVVQCAVVEL